MKATREDYGMIHQLYMSLDNVLVRAYPAMTRDDIEDAVQHAMNEYCAGVPDAVGSNPARLFRWLETVARRRLSREVRRRRHIPTFSDEWRADDIEPQGDAPDTTWLACRWSVSRILYVLTPVTARVVWLHDIDGWKPSEIANEMGCSINSINHRVKRAHSILRRMLKQDRKFLSGIVFGILMRDFAAIEAILSVGR